MPSLFAQGPSKAQEEPDGLEDYEDSEEEGEIRENEEEGEEEEGPIVVSSTAAQAAQSFLSKLAQAFETDNSPASVAPTTPGTGAYGSPSTQAASTDNSQTVAPVTAPLAPGTGASGSLSTQATSTEESDSSSLSMASGQESTVSDFGSSVTSLGSASGVQRDSASAGDPKATSSSERKTTVVPSHAAENTQLPSHPVTVSVGYTAQESLGNRGSTQAPTTTPHVSHPSTSDDLDIGMWDADMDADGDIEMPDFDPDVEMPDAPPLKRRRSRGYSNLFRDTPIRRRYWGLPGAPVRRFGERTADRKNAIRALSKVLSKGNFSGRSY
ncbi:hypothetical protein TWF481_011541 [Arthrobotrys musiformis]|uniref:Uncharacterized protein n=1 Tax=Arthrobotrys musiformis TaxID=47236 RepID=A0AAV9W0I0_9PEZI